MWPHANCSVVSVVTSTENNQSFIASVKMEFIVKLQGLFIFSKDMTQKIKNVQIIARAIDNEA
jgi:hypothetical protein